VTELDPIVRDALDRAVPPISNGGGDWDDVLRRADANVVALRRPRRRIWVAIAAAAALVALVVNPAFGIGGRVLDWFEGSPAPEEVKRGLSELDGPPEDIAALFGGPRVRADEARGVIALETSAGLAYLWAAPTDDGGWCWYTQMPEVPVEGGTTSSAAITCNSFSSAAERLQVGSSGEESTGLTLVEGRVQSPITSVELELGDGSREPVKLVNGFFLAEVPTGREAEAVIGRDADGDVVERRLLYLDHESSDGGIKAEARPPQRELLSIETHAGGRATLAVITPFVDSPLAEATCYAVTFPDGDSEGCPPLVNGIALSLVTSPAGKLTVLLSGFVGPDVASLEIRFQDGTRERIRLVERFFLYDVPPAHLDEGHLPTALVALDPQGIEIGRRPVRQQVF
jgi:hypothetical protein